LPAERTAIEALGEEAAEGDLLSLLDLEGWPDDGRIAGVLREPLLRLCARYLVRERAPSGRVLDPVAHFHLSNGARVERLNWLGDVSAKGLQQSAGIMVNYLYRLGEIEANHEAYRGEGRVAASSALRNLARIG
jgi:malonyl-CoA decarboxylase